MSAQGSWHDIPSTQLTLCPCAERSLTGLVSSPVEEAPARVAEGAGGARARQVSTADDFAFPAQTLAFLVERFRLLSFLVRAAMRAGERERDKVEVGGRGLLVLFIGNLRTCVHPGAGWGHGVVGDGGDSLSRGPVRHACAPACRPVRQLCRGPYAR